jgi:hypothetical protein
MLSVSGIFAKDPFNNKCDGNPWVAGIVNVDE